MRIAYTLPKITIRGGLERIMTAKANALAELGHEVFIITTCQRSRETAFPIDNRIRMIDLEINYEENYTNPRWRRIPIYWAKRRRHKQKLQVLLRELRLDFFISPLSGEAQLFSALTDGSIKLVESHGSRFDYLLMHRERNLSGLIGRVINRFRLWQNFRVARRADVFVVLTYEDQKLWRGCVDAEVIPNFIPISSHGASTLTNHRVMAAGRHVEQKNFSELISIWARLSWRNPSWRLEIYGDGPLRGELEAQIKSLGLSSVDLLPSTTRIEECYLGSSIYAMTSRYEGLPMVLIEAQRVGVPIVSYACQCGPSDIITDGENGFLVEVGDQETFASRLETLMRQDDLRQRMGVHALHNAQRFTREAIIARWVELFERKLAEKAR